ncbi:hypothetical protein JDV02_010718 [Purpureocillium takamizusanense]|nr:uncharacterized protein JDV02_010718 [Purpureocillium takamizusanense]UNI25010.1 hypothetical protein JDV02_010718 [Purpureocillium takamizusanense]
MKKPLGAGRRPAGSPNSTEVAPEDIALLNRYFSTKTMFDVRLGCDDEAEKILQASLTDPTVRHAVSSLKALREHLETSGDVPAPAPAAQQTTGCGWDFGVQRYCMALKGVASSLSSPGAQALKSALLCCQIFISIEQVRGNYGTMTQHIIQGLGIIHEYRARPVLATTGKLMPAYPAQLPLLDVFVIKLFAAPCKFAEPPTPADNESQTAVSSSCTLSREQEQAVESRRNFRTIVPNMRTALTKVAASTLEFLDKASSVESAETALGLVSEKESLLKSLESWVVEPEPVVTGARPPRPEPLALSFLRLFHQTLRVILVATLRSSLDARAELRTENAKLQRIADMIDERLRACQKSTSPS